MDILDIFGHFYLNHLRPLMGLFFVLPPSSIAVSLDQFLGFCEMYLSVLQFG